MPPSANLLYILLSVCPMAFAQKLHFRAVIGNSMLLNPLVGQKCSKLD